VLEARGIPTALLVTSPFLAKVRYEAASRGQPSLVIKSMPHPVASLPLDDLRTIVEQIAPQLVKELTTQSEPTA
jgi:hypothetical protein